MTRPRLLDLFCCEGGAAAGYQAAGFYVVGVDIVPQPNYRGDEFHQGDALTFPLDGFDAIHASPPCQAHTTMSNRHRGQGGKADSHVDLIAATRERLASSGLPYVIENVPGARNLMCSPVTLSGGMFGLKVDRPRLFESNVLLMAAPSRKVDNPVGVYGKSHDGRRLFTRKDGTTQRAAATLDEARDAMGMPWATWHGCTQAIPPAYTEFIGAQLLRHLAPV